MNIPMRAVLDEFDHLSLPESLLAPMSTARDAMKQSPQSFIDFLTDLYAQEDRLWAMGFRQLAVLHGIPAALRHAVYHLPALSFSGDPQKSVADVPLVSFRSWIRRLSLGLESNVATKSMLQYFQKKAPGGRKAPAAEKRPTTGALAAFSCRTNAWFIH